MYTAIDRVQERNGTQCSQYLSGSRCRFGIKNDNDCLEVTGIKLSTIKCLWW